VAAVLTIQSANDLLNYMLRGVVPSWGGATTLYVSLHTATIGAGGNQTTNEVSYAGYSRVPVAKNPSGGFTVAASALSQNNTELQFGNPSGIVSGITITHVAIGENASGTGTVIQYTALNSPLIINDNIQTKFAVGALDFTVVV
jgi:hypothetical protein